MRRLTGILSGVHRFLMEQHFYPLLLCSLLAYGILATRIQLTGRLSFSFLLWNLFLAWLPYLFSIGMAALYKRRWANPAILTLGVLWLLFYPNAPYLVTDVIHLKHIAPFNRWYDLGLVMMFAWAGLALAVASLHTVHGLVRRSFGTAAGWLFALSSILLTGIGIYLGRILRWNSWDALLHPRSVMADAVAPLLRPEQNRMEIGIILIFSALLLMCYLTFVSVRTASAMRTEQPL